MADRPQVYRAGKVEKLELYRTRLQKADKRDQVRLALEQERAIHEVLVELAQEQETQVNELRLIRRDMQALLSRLNEVSA